MITSVKPGKVNSRVVCSRSGDDGCNADCNHRTPHVEHGPYQTDCDDYNPCSMAGWCDDVGGTVRCLPHNSVICGKFSGISDIDGHDTGKDCEG